MADSARRNRRRSRQELPSRVRGCFKPRSARIVTTVAGIDAIAEEGPSLAHLASRETLGGGILRNPPESLTLWLTDPQAAKPGNRMPDTPLTAGERDALLAYLESLQ